MFYTYVLRGEKDGAFIVGYADNLERRVEEQQSGSVSSTKPHLPVALVFYEAYRNKQDAMRREQYYKTDKGMRALGTMMREDLRQYGCVSSKR